MFDRDPEIKAEAVWAGPVLRPATTLVRREGALLQTRQRASWQAVDRLLPAYASMLAEFLDPRTAPEMLSLREQIRSWRFYDHFRSDAAAPARAAQVGTRTPVLGHDGADLASAIATIQEVGDPRALDAAVDDAFPGASLEVRIQDGLFETTMRERGLLPGSQRRVVAKTGVPEAAQIRSQDEGTVGCERGGHLVERPHIVGEPVQENHGRPGGVAGRLVGDVENGGRDTLDKGSSHAAILSVVGGR